MLDEAEETIVDGVKVILEVELEALLELAEPMLLVIRFVGGSKLESSRLRFLDHRCISPDGVLAADEAIAVGGRYGGIERG